MVVVSSLGPPEEGIVHKEANVTTFLNEKNVGKGTLHIAEARVTWVGDAGAHTFSLEYNHIALHAVSRDLSVFPNAECLYLMIDVKLVESAPPTPRSTPETSDSDEDDGEGMTEIRFVPGKETFSYSKEEFAKLKCKVSNLEQCFKIIPSSSSKLNCETEVV